MFLTKEEVAKRFKGKRVAVVGSGPSCKDNEPGFIDSHDIVVRINNYKLLKGTGKRTDVFYSFFGASIKKERAELRRDGVKLCLCKCPDSKFIDSTWHDRHGKQAGVDFRQIYERRRKWWFCDTYIPTTDDFLMYFRQLDNHVPTTGFACILDMLSFECDLYITGFDFFTSGLHNVDEPWRQMNAGDPIRHIPGKELVWLANKDFRMDDTLKRLCMNIRASDTQTTSSTATPANL